MGKNRKKIMKQRNRIKTFTEQDKAFESFQRRRNLTFLEVTQEQLADTAARLKPEAE